MKDIETQLASWAELRHDTILYVKQPYDFTCGRNYPEGYVDPRVAAWEAIAAMCDKFADYQDTITGTKSVPPKLGAKIVKKENTSRRDSLQYFFEYKYNQDDKNPQGAFLRKFAYVASTLASMAKKQLKGEKYSDADVYFITNTVHEWGYMSGMPYGATGWYNHLYYKSTEDSKEWDPIVADVHTSSPDSNYNYGGNILHEAVGNVHAMYLALDFANGDKIVAISPVFSHYEFYLPPGKRMNDSEWRKAINNYNTPKQPDYTASYLVPGKNDNSAGYKYEKD